MPYVGLVLQKKQAAGVIDPEDNLPRGFTWRPTVNGRELQLPLLFNNPLSFAFFETKDGRMVTPTGLYPAHFTGFLNILGAPPDRAAIAAAIRRWDAEALDDKVGEAGMVMAIHRTKDEWLCPPARAISRHVAYSRNREDRRQPARSFHAEPDAAAFWNQGGVLQPRHCKHDGCADAR
jgi:hypothetical protein